MPNDDHPTPGDSAGEGARPPPLPGERPPFAWLLSLLLAPLAAGGLVHAGLEAAGVGAAGSSAGFAIGAVLLALLLAVHGSRRWIAGPAKARAELERFWRALDRAPAGIIITDAREADHPIVYANQGFMELTGYSREEILGQNCRFLNEHDRDQREIEKLRTAIERFEPISLIVRNRRKDGSRFWNRLTISPIRDADGLPLSMVGVQLDVTLQRERAAARRSELAGAQQGQREAEASSRARDRFFSYVSHELRAPLNAMNAWLSVLIGTDDETTVGRALEVLERNLSLQNRLIDDLVDAARITSGKLSLERIRCDLAEIVGLVFRGEAPVAAEHGIELSLTCPDSVPVDGDFERLVQVVSNLLGNAIKFTDEGGRIRLSVSLDGDQGAILQVEDTGRGISPTALPHVFDLYRQEDGEPVRDGQAGLGLGLAIVANIVEQHGGAVEAHSEGLAKGARFVVRLPVAEQVRAEREVQPEPSPDVLEGVRVLIADSNRAASEALALTLEEAGASVEWARDATAAETSADENVPDLFISGLPEGPGTELLRQLRSRVPRLRSLALVDARSGDLRSRLRTAGFQVALRRTLRPAEVRGRIVRLLGRQPRLLIVDDDHDAADSLALLMQRRGFDVSVAYGFDEALQLAGRTDLDLVVSDVSLGDGEGTELAGRLRVLGARRVVALSGHVEEDVEDAAAHFDGFVRKPVDLEALLAALAGS